MQLLALKLAEVCLKFMSQLGTKLGEAQFKDRRYSLTDCTFKTLGSTDRVQDRSQSGAQVHQRLAAQVWKYVLKEKLKL